MGQDINAYIDVCYNCAFNKGSVGKPVSIFSYPIPLEPWDTLAIDLLKLPMATEGHQYLLVATDHFSCYSILIPLKNKTAQRVATAFIHEVFCKFNTPKVSDNGAEFNNSILKEICNQFNIKKTNIIACHPASNGMVERQSRKILNHLRTLVGNISFSWDKWMHQAAASLGSSPHTSIGETPHFVVSGRTSDFLNQFSFKGKSQYTTSTTTSKSE